MQKNIKLQLNYSLKFFKKSGAEKKKNHKKNKWNKIFKPFCEFLPPFFERIFKMSIYIYIFSFLPGKKKKKIKKIHSHSRENLLTLFHVFD